MAASPNSAYAHSAFWKGSRSGRPGFTTSAVKVGSSVTFVRVEVSPNEAPSPAMPGAIPTAGAPDLILIGCVKQKLAVPAPAKDLYTSSLFRRGRHYAEDAGVPWFVLSTEHGLVMPEELLAPYDQRLAKSDRSYRRAWGLASSTVSWTKRRRYRAGESKCMRVLHTSSQSVSS